MLEARRLSFGYDAIGHEVLTNVSIAVPSGRIIGLAGPSGSGKSTLARLLCGHLQPQSGTVVVDGAEVERRGFNPVQMLAQTPVFAVNPRWTVGRVVREAYEPDAVLQAGLGVRCEWYERFPHELSGGELQRVSILRALAPQLRYLVADEISAMLDPITQAEIWRFLMEFARSRNVGILAISHDRALLARVASSVVEFQ